MMQNGLRSATKNNELFLAYQPQLDLSTGDVVGAEALLRWRHTKLGLVAPGTFIPIAENTGLIIPVGEWVLTTACTQARRWLDAIITSAIIKMAQNTKLIVIAEGIETEEQLHFLMQQGCDQAQGLIMANL